MDMPDSTDVNSIPAALKAPGEATFVCKEAASSALISASSISARSGWPNTDKTVIRPSASAFASMLATAQRSAMALIKGFIRLEPLTVLKAP